MWRLLAIFVCLIQVQALRLAKKQEPSGKMTEDGKRVLLAVLNISTSQKKTIDLGPKKTEQPQFNMESDNLDYMMQTGKYFPNMRKAHEAYAEKHGYDFEMIGDWIDQSRQGVWDVVSFQKVLVPTLNMAQKYDYVVVIDTDVLINPNAPAIHTVADFEDKIGGVDEMQPNIEINSKIKKDIKNFKDIDAATYYGRAGFRKPEAGKLTKILNTGVLVMQPRKHATMLQGIYDQYIHRQIGNTRRFHFEQSAVGYELQTHDKVEWLPAKWNFIPHYWMHWKDVGGEVYNVQRVCCEGMFINVAGHLLTTPGKVKECLEFMTNATACPQAS